MGVCICKVHGRSGIAEVCTHVRAAVLAGTKPPAFTTGEVDFGEPEMMHKMRFCAVCVAQHAMPPRITAEQWEEERERFHVEAVCGRCLREAIGT
jgi:hypothetical protein